MYEFKYPFESPIEDLVMQGVASNGTTWAIYDTFCKEFGQEEKARVDKKIMEIYIQEFQRQFLEEMKKQESNSN